MNREQSLPVFYDFIIINREFELFGKMFGNIVEKIGSDKWNSRSNSLWEKMEKKKKCFYYYIAYKYPDVLFR